MDSNYQTPDLASILRTLSQAQNPISGPPTTQSTVSSFRHGQITPNVAQIANRGHTQDYAPFQNSSAHPQTTLSYSNGHHIPAPRTSQPPKAEIDPRTITTWAPALRYVTKLLTKNEDITERIRKLIKSQHDHEKQWAKGREMVVEERRKRDEGRNAVNDILCDSPP